METKQEDKLYTVTEIFSKSVNLTKEQYEQHLLSKLRFRHEELEDIKIKKVKLDKEFKTAKSKLDEVSSQLEELVGNVITLKHLEYERWAFKEKYPKKYKILKDNYMGY